MCNKAFTLVELLVVTAITAILATIALPNYMEARVRSRMSRTKSDMWTVGVAVETFNLDEGSYPSVFTLDFISRLLPLTTPVAYLSRVPEDIFAKGLPPAFKNPDWMADHRLHSSDG